MRTTGCILALIGLFALGVPAPAQTIGPFGGDDRQQNRSSGPSSELHTLQEHPPPADAALIHVVGGRTMLHNRPDSSTPVKALPVRTPLHRLDCADDWCRVRTDDGRSGYVPASNVSNLWLRVSKSDRRLFVYRGPRLVDTFRIDLGYNTFSDKQRRGSTVRRDHWRTPEGTFYVVAKQAQSAFYKALVLNYPTIPDAERGLKKGLISKEEYDAIVNAQNEHRMPPMNTDLGGWIEIHGEGTGASTNWTQGCVAVKNRVMNALWLDVEVGTPVLVE